MTIDNEGNFSSRSSFRGGVFLERAFLFLYAVDDDAGGESKVILLLLESAGLKIIGLQSNGKALIDFVIQAAAGH